MRLGIAKTCLEMVWFIDCSYKQDAPSIVIINMIFAGSSRQSPVWINNKIVVPSRQNSSFPHLHPIPLIKGGIRILEGCNRSQLQLESSENESAVMLSMLHSEGEEHVTTLTSVSLGTACRRISWISYCGTKPGALWTTMKRSILLEQLFPSVVKFSQRMVLL